MITSLAFTLFYKNNSSTSTKKHLTLYPMFATRIDHRRNDNSSIKGVLTIYQTARKLHLLVGLILSLVLLVESVTGLMLAEPGLFGLEKSRPPMANPSSNSEQNKSAEVRNDNPPYTRTNRGTPPTNGLNVLGLAKGLHQGRLGEWNTQNGLLILQQLE
jgi:hypothetical protein